MLQSITLAVAAPEMSNAVARSTKASELNLTNLLLLFTIRTL
jgi:hypothetical protein